MKTKGTIRLIILASFSMIALSFGAPLLAQESGKNLKLAEIDAFEIPPLGPLIDSALSHSPLLEEQTALITMRQWQERSAKEDWGRYLLFFSEMRYGTIDILISNGGVIGYGNRSNTTSYNIGTRLQLTIFDFLDLKNKRGVARSQTKYEEMKKEELQRMIKDDVIRLWNKLVSYKQIVSINEDHLVVQNSNILYAEEQFKAGDIPLLEYSRIKEISIKADVEYQLAKKEFREAYMLLESLAGVKLSAMNQNHQ